MKRIVRILLFCLLMIFILTPFYGQESSNKTDSLKEYKSIIKVEVLNGGLQFEQKIKENSSVNVGIQYGYELIFNPKEYDYNLTLDYRYSFSNKRNFIFDFYLGGLAYYKDYSVADDKETNSGITYSRDNVKTIGLGLKGGMERRFLDRFKYEFFFGIGYNIYKDIKNIEGVPILNPDKLNINAVAGLNFGYLF